MISPRRFRPSRRWRFPRQAYRRDRDQASPVSAFRSRSVERRRAQARFIPGATTLIAMGKRERDEWASIILTPARASPAYQHDLLVASASVHSQISITRLSTLLPARISGRVVARSFLAPPHDDDERACRSICAIRPHFTPRGLLYDCSVSRRDDFGAMPSSICLGRAATKGPDSHRPRCESASAQPDAPSSLSACKRRSRMPSLLALATMAGDIVIFQADFKGATSDD